MFVTSTYELTGEFDLVVELISPNPSKFNKELKKISMMIPSMPDYKVILNIVSYIYPRDYLPTRSELKLHSMHSIVGGDREYVMLNKNELLVIKSLLSRPKARLTELAKEARLNIKTAKGIIESLEKRKIIKGYKYVLDTSKLGLNKCRLFVKLHNLSRKREDELMKLMQETEDIVQINKTIGDWNLEIDVETQSSARTRYLIMQVRKEFRDIIESVNMIEFFTYYKSSYLPSFLFESI